MASFGNDNKEKIQAMMMNVGSLITTINLNSDECTKLLKQALERERKEQRESTSSTTSQQVIHPATTTSSSLATNRHSDNIDSSDDDVLQHQTTEEEDYSSTSSSSESEAEAESGGEGELAVDEALQRQKPQQENESSSKSSQEVAVATGTTTTTTTNTTRERKSKKKKFLTQTQQQKQRQITIKKHVDNLICHSLPINDTDVIQIPKSLLTPKRDIDLADRNYIPPLLSEEYLSLNQSLQQSSKCNVLIILLRSGRFAAGIFDSCNNGKCIVHKVCTHYTVRRGQGKAQSSQDNARRPKSMGAQLRRAGEEKLQTDITETLDNWKSHIEKSCLIILSIPKAMQKYFFDATSATLAKHDSRIRRLPLDVGKPTYDNVCIAYETMMTVQIKQYQVVASKTTTTPSLTTTTTPAPNDDDANKAKEKKNEEQQTIIKIFPLTPLHIACQKGDIDTISNMLLQSTNASTYPCEDENGQEISMTVQDMISQKAGPYFMTCLHYAAASASTSGVNVDNDNADDGVASASNDDVDVVDPEIAAECVTKLLLDGKADPTIVDSRNRLPIFLATQHDKIKNAFRICRSKLGEEYCVDWSTKGKIGPPLTDDDIQAKKDREAEKRRKKKARQKQKKQQEKADSAIAEQQRQEEEAKRLAEETAKRIRDGLQPKFVEANANACDFCQKIVKGRKRKDMFTRLDYKYCSSECVQKHKRELMASAALARFGN